MIPMAMREHDAFDEAEIEAELPCIALECVSLRPGVEQNRVRYAVAMRGDQAGEAVIGAADALAGQNAHALAIEIGKLGLDVTRNAGQAVGRVDAHRHV